MTKQKNDLQNVKPYQEATIPGTTIPKDFYVTIRYDTQKLLDTPLGKWSEALETEFRCALAGAKKIIRDYRIRYRYFKYIGADVGKNFEPDYHYAWCTTDDGTIQLLRLDMIPMSMRTINAEMDFLDGAPEFVER